MKQQGSGRFSLSRLLAFCMGSCTEVAQTTAEHEFFPAKIHSQEWRALAGAGSGCHYYYYYHYLRLLLLWGAANYSRVEAQYIGTFVSLSGQFTELRAQATDGRLFSSLPASHRQSTHTSTHCYSHSRSHSHIPRHPILCPARD
jgi:hypothetical protein